ESGEARCGGSLVQRSGTRFASRERVGIKGGDSGIDGDPAVSHLPSSRFHERFLFKKTGTHFSRSCSRMAPQPRRRSMMPNDTRELPANNNGMTRFLGGSPLSVAFRLILLSILVGVVLAAIGFDPWNIVYSIRLLFQRIWDLGFDAINGLWRYFLLGAVIVIPVWLLSRLFGTPRPR